jgi:hypothetical protein
MHETRDCSKEIINVGEGHGKVTSTKKDFWESRSKKRSKDPICNVLYYIGPHMNKLPSVLYLENGVTNSHDSSFYRKDGSQGSHASFYRKFPTFQEMGTQHFSFERTREHITNFEITACTKLRTSAALRLRDTHREKPVVGTCIVANAISTSSQ